MGARAPASRDAIARRRAYCDRAIATRENRANPDTMFVAARGPYAPSLCRPQIQTLIASLSGVRMPVTTRRAVRERTPRAVRERHRRSANATGTSSAASTTQPHTETTTALRYPSTDASSIVGTPTSAASRKESAALQRLKRAPSDTASHQMATDR